MKPRPRWEVRTYAWNYLAHSCGLPVTKQLLSVRTFRWRWLARLCSLPPVGAFMGTLYWTEVHRAPPKLRVVPGYRPRGNFPASELLSNNTFANGTTGWKSGAPEDVQ